MAQYKVSVERHEVHELTVEANSPTEAFLLATSVDDLGRQTRIALNNRWVSFDLVSGKPLQTFDSWNHWETQFSPMENHITQHFFNAILGRSTDAYGVIEAVNSATIFESSSAEQAFLNDVEETHIWTFYRKGDVFELTNGYLDILKALGYLVTEQRWSEDRDYRVLLGKASECPDCDSKASWNCQLCQGLGELVEIYR